VSAEERKVGEDEDRGRLAPLAALLVGAMMLMLALGLARVVTQTVGARRIRVLEDYEHPSKRQGMFVDALPIISARKENAAFAIGSSIAFFGFSPERFDAELKERGIDITSYSATAPITVPSIELALTRKIRSAYERRSKRVSLGLLELPPHGMTLAGSKYPPFVRAEQRSHAELLDPKTLLDMLVRTPEDGARVLSMAALGEDDEGRTQAALAEALGLIPKRNRGGGPELALVMALEKRERGPYQAWNMRTRGEPRWLYPETREAYRQVHRAFVSATGRHQHRLVTQNDAIDLHINPRRVEEFIETVREMQKIADRTIVWLAPRNSRWLAPSPEGTRRLSEALAEIERATGVDIINMTTTPGIGPDDFLDASHLDEHSGRRKFSKAFAHRVATLLGAPQRREVVDDVTAIRCGSTEATASVEAKPEPMPEGRGQITSCLEAEHLEHDEVHRFDSTWRIAATKTGAKLFRISFRTARDSGSQSTEAVTSAQVLIPDKVKHPGIVVVVTHGTTGIAEGCAPSPRPSVPLALIMASAGFVTVAPDYAGHRAKDWPPVWLASEEAARTIFDSVRATGRLLVDSHKPKRVLLFGQSQGGHAVLSAQALARADGFDVPIAGVVAVSPIWLPKNLFAMLTADAHGSGKGNRDTMFSLFYYYSRGELFDGAGEGTAMFKPEKRDEIMRLLSTKCVNQQASFAQALPSEFFSEDFIHSIEACASGGTCEAPGRTWFERFGRDRPDLDPQGAPVMLLQGSRDPTVTPPRAKCAIDSVKQALDPGRATICVDPAATHLNVVERNVGRIVEWLEARASGSAVGTPRGCQGEEKLAEVGGGECPSGAE
jgi:pimeloyl-ACP methyl ester carboxylesterase